MTDITEQARARQALMDWPGLQSLSMLELDDLVKRIANSYTHVQSHSLADAVEEVKRLRDEWQQSADNWGMGSYENRTADLARTTTANEIIEALQSLQGKAGVSEQAEPREDGPLTLKLWICAHCLAPRLYGSSAECYQCGKKLHYTNRYFREDITKNAATTLSSVEAPAGTAFEPKHLGFPEPQSPRVCVSECLHLRQTFPGTNANECCDCGIPLP